MAHIVGGFCVPHDPAITAFPEVANKRQAAKLENMFESLGEGQALEWRTEVVRRTLPKEEIETVLRTPGAAGFQLLDVHDFPGQGTALVGVLPTYEKIGIWAPILLVSLRLAQGLALGGEYGGAATYVAEHAPHGKRGAYTSWIQTTATLGFFLSLAVILACRLGFGEDAFKARKRRYAY